MSTLQELIEANPDVLLNVTRNGTQNEKINKVKNVTVYMDSGLEFHRTSGGWEVTRQEIYHRKADMIVNVDNTTQILINRGFSYDGEYFSLSVPAQANWNALVTRLLCGKLTFPYNVTTIDDDTYTITTMQSFNDFIDAAVYVVGYNLEVGRYYKSLIINAATHEDLDAFVDPRS